MCPRPRNTASAPSSIARGGRSIPRSCNAFVNSELAGRDPRQGLLLAGDTAPMVGEISQAGAMVRTGKRGLWWAAVPRPRNGPTMPSGAPSMKPASRSGLGRPPPGDRLHRLRPDGRGDDPRRTRPLSCRRLVLHAGQMARSRRSVPVLAAPGCLNEVQQQLPPRRQQWQDWRRRAAKAANKL
jgi:hypothetical protein